MSVELKQLNYERALEINTFWERDWSEYTLPDNEMKIIDAVAVKDGKAIAYGQVRHFAEMMLFTDMTTSRKDRMQSLQLLMAEGFRGADKARLREVYCLIKDMRFARLISKHFDFQLVENPGVLLVKKLG